ncbi:MAG: anthranilate synthase component I, partial [Planctomycetota bacterium]
MKHYHPNFDEFLKLAERGNTIPVYRQLLADALTPVMAYERLATPPGFAPASHSFLLESVVGGERIARFSFVAADPEANFVARREKIEICRGREEKAVTSRDPLAELAKMLEPYKAVHLPGLPRFTGGVVGYAAYDMIRYYESLGEGPPDDRGLPDLSFGLYRTMVIFDHVSKTIKVVHNAHVTGDPGTAYTEATEAIERTVNRLAEGSGRAVGQISLLGLPQKAFRSNFSRDEYMNMVEACKEYIRAGDILQVVSSQRLTVETTAKP